MRSPQYAEDVILCLLREAESGTPIDQICFTAKISIRTFYRWRAQYGGLTPAAARERNDLLHENNRLRALVAELAHRRPGEAMKALAPPRSARQEASSGRFASVRGRR